MGLGLGSGLGGVDLGSWFGFGFGFGLDEQLPHRRANGHHTDVDGDLGA